MRARLALLACAGVLAIPAAAARADDGGYVHGVVFEDANADGAGPQSGEAGLAGWLVWVDRAGQGLPGSEPATAAGADGAYRLGPLAPGAYTVRVQPAGGGCPPGATCARTVQVAAGQDALVDFPVVTGADPGRILLGEGGLKVGAVKLSVPRGCRLRPFQATLIGNGVTRVDFRLDGRTIRSVRAPDRAGRFSVRVDPRRLRPGRHALAADVFFGRTRGSPEKRAKATLQTCLRG